MAKLSLLLHMIGSTSFAYAIYFDAYELNLPEEVAPRSQQFGGLGKYLTFLNMCLQLVYFTLCIVADLSAPKSRISRVKDVLFASAAFPIGIFVAVIFWGLYAVDRELIFPERLDAFFPNWLNHFMHTTVLPLQLGELYLSRHRYPSRMLGGGITALLTLGYLVWIHVIYYYGGFWVYPVFSVLTPATRPIFMAICCLMGAAFYLLGEVLNNQIWGEAVFISQTERKVRKLRKEN